MEANFDAMKNYVKTIIQRLRIGPNSVRVSLVRFSQTATVAWGLTRYNSASELERAIDGVQIIRGRTNIAAGIKCAYREAFQQDKRANVPYLAMIITDGYANTDVEQIAYEASVARALGIHFVGVGIVDVNYVYRLTYDKVINVRHEMVTQLVSVASSERYVYMYGSYSELSLAVNVDSVVNALIKLCYREIWPPPQPRDFYCRDTCCHGLQCWCRQDKRPINGTRCTDVDECETRNGECSQQCTNTPGSFFCSCRNGYELGANGWACLDIDECRNSPGICGGGTCMNIIGGYKCIQPNDEVAGVAYGAMIGAAAAIAAPTTATVAVISVVSSVGSVILAFAVAFAVKTIVRRREAAKLTEDNKSEVTPPSPALPRNSYGSVTSKFAMARGNGVKATF